MNTVSHWLSELRTNRAVTPHAVIEGKVIRLHALEKRSYPSVTFSNWVPWLVTVGEEDRNKYTICNTTNITITSQLNRNCTRAIVLVKSVQRSKNFVEKRTLNLMTARVLTTLKPLSNQPGVVAWVLTNFLQHFSLRPELVEKHPLQWRVETSVRDICRYELVGWVLASSPHCMTT